MTDTAGNFPELDDDTAAQFAAELDRFSETGEFDIPVAEANWGKVNENWLNVAEMHYNALDPHEKASIDAEVEGMLQQVRRMGIDPTDATQVHAFVWGLFFQYGQVWHRTHVECENPGHALMHIDRAASYVGVLALALQRGTTA